MEAYAYFLSIIAIVGLSWLIGDFKRLRRRVERLEEKRSDEAIRLHIKEHEQFLPKSEETK